MTPFDRWPIGRRDERVALAARAARERSDPERVERAILVTTIPNAAGVIGAARRIARRVLLRRRLLGMARGRSPRDDRDGASICSAKSTSVIATSEKLFEEKSALHPRVRLLRHGVDADAFRDPRPGACPRRSPRCAGRSSVRRGSSTLASTSRSSSDLARSHPEVTFAFVGPRQLPSVPLDRLENVRFLPAVPYADVPAVVHAFDVASCRTWRRRLTERINPLKLREYLAAGVPVVATPLPEAAALCRRDRAGPHSGRVERGAPARARRRTNARRSAPRARRRRDAGTSVRRSSRVPSSRPSSRVGGSAMNVLVISTMYPNETQPVHAVFVEQRIRALAERVALVVVVPIPWFPFTGSLASLRASRADSPQRDPPRDRGPLSAIPFVPENFETLGRRVPAARLLAVCLEDPPRRRPDLLDAHLAFPDGWSAVLLGRALRIPVSVTLRGHDLNDLPRYPVRRRQVAWTLARADLVIAVADALRSAALSLGAIPEKTITVGNGVDMRRFTPQDRGEARRRLGLDEKSRIVLSVGHLVERKGFHHLVRAFPKVLARASRSATRDRRRPGGRRGFRGVDPQDDSRLQVSTSASACAARSRTRISGPGTRPPTCSFLRARRRVARTCCSKRWPRELRSWPRGVWGTPEVVADDSLGILVDAVDPETLGGAVAGALSRTWDRARIAASAGRFSWTSTTDAIVARWSELVRAKSQGVMR